MKYFYLILCLVSSSTFALDHPWYEGNYWHLVISQGVGAAIVNNNASITQSFTIDHSTQTALLLDGFLGVEWNLKNWIFQSGIDFNQSTLFRSNGVLIIGSNVNSRYDYHYKIIYRQLLLEGKTFYNMTDVFHPFLLIGVGGSFNQAFDYEDDAPASINSRNYGGNHQYAFSYVIGLGVDYNITDVLRIGLTYQFKDLGKITLGQARIKDTAVQGTLSQSHFYVNDLLGQLTITL